jgi:hypothetical protein
MDVTVTVASILDSMPDQIMIPVVQHREEHSDCKLLSLFCSFLLLFKLQLFMPKMCKSEAQLTGIYDRMLPGSPCTATLLLLEQYHNIISMLLKQ